MSNKNRKTYTIAAILAGIAAMVSCTNYKGLYTAAPEVSFSNDIIPIFRTSCALNGNCHSGTSNAGDNMDFDSSAAYHTISSKGLINYSNLTSSLLYVEISSGLMPKSPYNLLPAAQSNLILDWINQGAKNN